VSFGDIFFSFPFTLSSGVRAKGLDVKAKRYVGCDLCFWFWSIWTPPFKKPQVRADQDRLCIRFILSQFYANDVGSTSLHYAVDLTCQYDARNRAAARKCKKLVDSVRYHMNEDTYANGNTVRQYYNTPSCHDLPNEKPFYQR